MPLTQQSAYLVAWVGVAALAWFLWHPLGAFLIVMSIGHLRPVVQRNAMFWEKPKYAVIFGCVAGFGAALLVQAVARFSFYSPYSAVGISVLGLIAVGYIGVPATSTRYQRCGSLSVSSRDDPGTRLGVHSRMVSSIAAAIAANM